MSAEETVETAEEGIDKILIGRIAFAASGILLLIFGAFRLFTQIEWATLLQLALWMAAAIILHDMIIAPATIGVATLLGRVFPDRARRWLQFWLIPAALVSVIAIPMIVLQGSQPREKALLVGPYAPGYALILGILAVIAGVGYVLDRRRSRPAEA